jgi:hypothetical protein
MALMLVPKIMNPGHQSLVSAQHVWRGVDMTLLIQKLLWSIQKKWDDKHNDQTKQTPCEQSKQRV